MVRYHKTSHGRRKMRIVGYSITTIPKQFEPKLNSRGLPKGFKDLYTTKAEAQNAVKYLRATQLYKSLKIVELKV